MIFAIANLGKYPEVSWWPIIAIYFVEHKMLQSMKMVINNRIDDDFILNYGKVVIWFYCNNFNAFMDYINDEFAGLILYLTIL